MTQLSRSNGSPVAGRHRSRSRLAAILGVAALVAACQAGSAGPTWTFAPAGSSGAAATDSSVSPSDTPAPSATQSPLATATPTSEASGSPTVSAAPSASAVVAVDPRDGGFDVVFGEFAITLEADAIRPGRVTFVVHNAGKLVHGLEMKIDRSGSGSGSGGDRQKIETRTFRSGETLRVEADLPAGVYKIECFVADHSDRGMETELVVRADAPLTTTPPATATAESVRIVQFAFVAAALDVPVGTTVTWTNEDPAPHTVTADDGSFDSKQLDPGRAFSIKMDTPGTYAYLCEIHPTMVGTVVVR